METWKSIAVLTALLYGMYNVFTKLAAGNISDSFGAFLLEIVAALLILGFIFFLRFKGENPIQFNAQGLLFSIFAGISVAIVSILYFMVFRTGGHLSVAGPFILVGGSIVMIVIGVLFFKEPISVRSAAGLILGLVGLYLMK